MRARQAAASFERELGRRLLAGPAFGSVLGAREGTVSGNLVPLLERGLPAAAAALATSGFVATAAVRAPVLDDADDRAELAAAVNGRWADLPESSRSATVTLASPADLPAKLLLETQARRLELGLLPGVGVAVCRALAAGVGAPVRVEEYYVDRVYRTAYDRDDYTDVQLELTFT